MSTVVRPDGTTLAVENLRSRDLAANPASSGDVVVDAIAAQTRVASTPQ
jgi:hypothetical protein